MHSEVAAVDAEANQMKRLVDFNTNVLLQLLRKMVAMRGTEQHASQKRKDLVLIKRYAVLDEVQEIITLPAEPMRYHQDPEMVELSREVVSQLRGYVEAIASMYKQNPFHSFYHASHVTMSVTKLLSRVVTPEAIDYSAMSYKPRTGVAEQHRFTYGLTSDPLTHFAVAFAALIHDVVCCEACDCGLHTHFLVHLLVCIAAIPQLVHLSH